MTDCAMPTSSSAEPWYRQRWPWLLFAGPAIVVVAGIVTAWIAARTDDGLIAEDYYKRGLLINKDLERARQGDALGVGAVVRVAPGGELTVELTGPAGTVPQPVGLRLSLSHPTRAGDDVALALARGTDGVYRGRASVPAAGRWIVTLESDAWRLQTPAAATGLSEVRLGAARATN
jgi:uncharacterized protein